MSTAAAEEIETFIAALSKVRWSERERSRLPEINAEMEKLLRETCESNPPEIAKILQIIREPLTLQAKLVKVVHLAAKAAASLSAA